MLVLNLIGYFVYGLASIAIIAFVGWYCYHYGAVFLKRLFKHDEDIALTLNKLLLSGYYLLNIGYVAITLSYWQTITTASTLPHAITYKIGFIVLLLGVMHFINMASTYLLAKIYFTPTNPKPNNNGN